MNNKKHIYRLDDRALDSLNRFVKSRNPLTYLFNILFNLILFFGRTLKKLIGKNTVNIIKESEATKENIETSDVISLDSYHSLNELYELKNIIVLVNLRKESNETSGAQDYTNNKIIELEKEYNGSVIELSYKKFSDNWFIKLNNTNTEIALNDLTDIEELFKTKNIKLVFINNMIFYNNIEKLIDLLCVCKKEYSFELHYAFHDYLSICPSNFLINKDGQPCEIKECNECIIQNNYRSLVRNDINKWREMFTRLFECTSKVLFFSNFTKGIVLHEYPILDTKYELIPHKKLINDDATKYIRPTQQNSINIGFVGYFHHIKGSDYFIEVIEKLKKKYNINATIIGYLEQGKENEFEYSYKVTGRYNRNNLGKVLTENNIDMVIYPSINSETYSYIVQELMYLNVPFTVFRRGAPAERIEAEKYELAEIADEVSSQSMYDATVRLLKKLNLI